MSKTVAILALISAGAALGCMHLARELRTERAQVEALQSRIAELERAASERNTNAPVTAETPFSPLPAGAEIAAATPNPPARSEREKPANAVPGAVPPDIRERMLAHRKQQRELLQDPKYREAMRAQHRVHMDSAYPGLGEAMAFTKEETDRFLDFLSQQRIESMEQASDVIWDASDPASARTAEQAMLERQQREQAEMDAQFGPNTYQKWTDYQQTLGQRHRLAAMQAQLALAGTPLDAEQSKAVLDALVAEQRQQMRDAGSNQLGAATAVGMVGFGPVPGMSDLDTYVKQQERSHERLVSSLQSTLSPQQLSQFEAMLKRDRDAHRASLELMRAQGLDHEQRGIVGGWSTSAPGAMVTFTSATVEPPQERSEQQP